jgi:hypothetical protein
MGLCRAAVISPLNGDALVVEVAGGGVATFGEVSAGVAAAEAAKKFCLGGPLPCGIHFSYFHHQSPTNVPPYLCDGMFVELTAVGVMDIGVNCNATWSKVMTQEKECKVSILAILDAQDSEPIAATLTCHLVWNLRKMRQRHNQLTSQLLMPRRIMSRLRGKKAVTKKKVAKKRKATSELRKVATTATAEATVSGAVDLTY